MSTLRDMIRGIRPAASGADEADAKKVDVAAGNGKTGKMEKNGGSSGTEQSNFSKISAFSVSTETGQKNDRSDFSTISAFSISTETGQKTEPMAQGSVAKVATVAVAKPGFTLDDLHRCDECSDLSVDGRCLAAARGVQFGYAHGARYSPCTTIKRRCGAFRTRGAP